MKKIVCLLLFIVCCLNSYSQQEINCKYIIEGNMNYKVYDTKERTLIFDSVNNTFTIPNFGYLPAIEIKINHTENKPFRDGDTNYNWYYGHDRGGENYILVMQENKIHLFWILDEVSIKEYILSLE